MKIVAFTALRKKVIPVRRSLFIDLRKLWSKMRFAANLEQLERDFAAAITEMNSRLAAFNAVLAPTGMHPFMDPSTEGKTWSKGNRTIYETYDRIFGCSSHGWFNLQSCHINLPFANEEEFGRLHAAIILILPYLPALSASSPFIEGKASGFLDTRLDVYKNNQAKVPEIAGQIVPEPVFTYADYQSEILEKTYAAITPYDTDGILQYEWLNSRGAIARFDRNAIEIRVLDTQECPSQDIGICSLIIAVLERLCSLDVAKLQELAKSHTTAQRKAQFMAVARDGFEAHLTVLDLAQVFELSPGESTVGELWAKIVEATKDHPRVAKRGKALGYILQEGNISERMLSRIGKTPTQEQLKETMAELSRCLSSGAHYEASSK